MKALNLIALLTASLAVFSVFMPLPFVSAYAFWFLVAAFLMVVGTGGKP
jgi:hypothetical protein